MKDQIRALRVIGLSNEARVQAANNKDQDIMWFLEHIDELAPDLLRQGWIEHKPFSHQIGSVVVTDGKGNLCSAEITELGKKQLNAAVS